MAPYFLSFICFFFRFAGSILLDCVLGLPMRASIPLWELRLILDCLSYFPWWRFASFSEGMLLDRSGCRAHLLAHMSWRHRAFIANSKQCAKLRTIVDESMLAARSPMTLSAFWKSLKEVIRMKSLLTFSQAHTHQDYGHPASAARKRARLGRAEVSTGLRR